MSLERAGAHQRSTTFAAIFAFAFGVCTPIAAAGLTLKFAVAWPAETRRRFSSSNNPRRISNLL